MHRLYFLFILVLIGCSNQSQKEEREILPGANQMNQYLSMLEGKSVGLTVNHSSLIAGQHLTDTLIQLGISVDKVFTPEHGFTGTLSDGVIIEYDSILSDYELISLYGKNKKPTSEQLENLDIMIFDMQDVGTRFFTYISTMHYLMEACAENDVPLVILDRPNPNGSYVDGPILDMAFKSFVGMHPIPIVHGMTVGELAQMINNEGWLNDQKKVDLTVIKVANWNHRMPYALPIKPSPNLPDDLSVSLYPSLCLFEGTIMSVGRGTDYAFQQIGHPEYPDSSFSFTPKSRQGAKWPPLENQKCFGVSWKKTTPNYAFSLEPLLNAYEKMNRDDFFNNYFNTLAGSDELQKQIKAGMSESEIRETWSKPLNDFKIKRETYLLYD